MIEKFVNIYLPYFFDWVIETSILASILVALILCVKTLLRNKLSPRWHYLLWIILIVRMIIPWSPLSSYSIYSILSYSNKATDSVQSQLVVSSEKESIHEVKEMPINKVINEEEHNLTNTLPVPQENNKEITSNIKENNKPISLYTIALYIWLTGVFVLGFTTYLINSRLSNYIKKQPIIEDKRILNIYNDCKNSMSVQKSIPLLLAGKVSSPTVLGFFRPRVLLSTALINQLTERQLRHIFYHELAHIKRRDVGVNWIFHSLIILNWFNPILWWAYYCMREDQELACDAYALTFMEEEEKISYGHTVISLLEHYSNYYQVPSIANLSRNKRTLKRRIFMIKKFQKKSYRWSALGVIAIIVVSLLSFLNAHAEGSDEKRKEPTKSNFTTEEDKKELGNNSYTPPVKEEFHKEQTKEEVLTKLLNTVDNFRSASGKFEQYNKYKDNSTSKVIVEYKISLKNSIGGYEKVLNIPDEKVPGAKIITNELFYNDQTIWNIDYDRMTYVSSGYEIKPKRELVKPEDVFSIPINKIYDSNDKFRERPPIGTSGLSLFPYEMIVNYLRFNDLWKIEKQNEELLGHNTIVLNGSIDKSIVNTLQPNESSFRFWVDKDTGILLKYEIYNDNGEIISYLHPETLSINVPIDSKQFIPNLDNYKMQVPDTLNIESREKDIKVIEHADAIDKEVVAVLNILRTKVPFLYEFSNPELKIFSASMEKYKEFNQAYLTYEGKEPGSGVIYVRTYHKDSYVSSLRDFNKEKGEELDAFTLNGINWTVFEIKNTPNAHFIGSSGDYKYEVVTQGISIDDAKRLLESFNKSAIKQ